MIAPGIAEEHHHRAGEHDQHGRTVGQRVTVDKGLARRGDDLLRILRIAFGQNLCAGEGFGERGLGLTGDLIRIRRRRDGLAEVIGVSGGEDRTENGLQDRSAEIALQSDMLDAIPARCTGTDPVSDRDAGVPASPTPIPTNR